MLPFTLVFQGALCCLVLRQVVLAIQRRVKTTQLRGPASESIIYGVMKRLAIAPDAGAVYETWADAYGPAFQVSGLLGTKRIVLCDPKAISHVLALDSWKYSHSPMARKQLSSVAGENALLLSMGEIHKRKRRVVNPVFGPTAIKSYTPVFFDAGYKVKTAWDAIIQSRTSDEVIIDISEWMNRVSLDVIGLACFSHDFGSLLGRTSAIPETLAALGKFKPSKVTTTVMLLAQVFPWLLALPLPRNILVTKLSNSIAAVADSLLQKGREEGTQGNSAVAVLLRAENVKLSQEEVRGHMKSILLAGNESTSVSLKVFPPDGSPSALLTTPAQWVLVELCMHPDKQDKLRAELAQFTTADPTYEDLTNSLPYLDAVVRESLRLHATLGETTRVALEDDVIPLSQQVKTASGTIVDRLMIPKGASVNISLHYVNRASSIWGDDCKTFNPERWLTEDGLPQRAKEFPGYHHTLTFLDGQRACLGKGFALGEIKAVISVLIRNYIFVPRDGPGTTFTTGGRLARHPKVQGEEGTMLPMRIRRVE